jgi:hypothetical protein
MPRFTIKHALMQELLKPAAQGAAPAGASESGDHGTGS